MLKSDTPRTDELLCKLYGTERCEAEKIVNAFARQLERELELLRAELLGTQKINKELRDRCAELEKDAARYRWWRDNYWGSDEDLDEINALSAAGVEDWDSAIDKAIAASLKSR